MYFEFSWRMAGWQPDYGNWPQFCIKELVAIDFKYCASDIDCDNVEIKVENIVRAN